MRCGLAAAALVTLALGRQALGWVQHWLAWRVRLGVHYGLQRAFVARLLELPLAFFRREGVNGITTKMDRGINGVVGAFGTLTTQLLPNLAYLAFPLAAMFALDRRLLLVALVVGPLPALVGVWAVTEQVARERRLLGHWTRIYARFHSRPCRRSRSSKTPIPRRTASANGRTSRRGSRARGKFRLRLSRPRAAGTPWRFTPREVRLTHRSVPPGFP